MRSSSPLILSILSLCIANAANAAIEIEVVQVGFDVFVTGSGSADTSQLGVPVGISLDDFVDPAAGNIVVGGTFPPATTAWGYLGITGPTSFGTGGQTTADDGVLEVTGILNDAMGFGPFLVVPDFYSSGDPFLSDSFYGNTTLSDLGLAPGTYDWTWPAAEGGTDSLTLRVSEQVTLEDLTFFNSDWSTTPLFQIGCSQPASAEMVLTGGNLQSYREMTHYPCTGQLRIYHEYTPTTFDPSTLLPGTSFELSQYREDRRVVSAPVPNAAMNASPAVRQGEIIYTANVNASFTSTTWETLELGNLDESDFVQWNGSMQPDFSSSGGLIHVGFIRYGGNVWEDPMVHGIDNWSVTANALTTPVPEPGATVSILSGVVVLFQMQRRRRRGSRGERPGQ